MVKLKISRLDLTFVEAEYKEIWDEWMSYKEQIRNPYKTQLGVEKAYKHLKNMSNNNPDIARAYVDYSIEREWKGIYPCEDAIKHCLSRQRTIFEAAKEVLQRTS